MFEKINLFQRMIIFVLLPSIIIFGGIISLSGLQSFTNATTVLGKVTNESNANLAVASSGTIEAFLEKVSRVPKVVSSSTIVLGVEEGSANSTQLRDEFKRVLDQTEEIIDLYYFSNTRFEAHVWVKGENGELLDFSPTVTPEDYPYFEVDWFTNPVNTKSFQFSEPYFDVGGLDDVMISAVAPVLDSNNNVLGVVGCDILISTLIQQVESIEVGDNGYAFLITDSGMILTHPDDEYKFSLNYETPKSISDWATSISSSQLSSIGSQMTKGTVGSGEFNGLLVNYHPIDIVDWSIGIVLPANEIPSSLSDLLLITLISAAFGIVILAVLVLYMARSFSAPITKLAGFSSLMGDNDLTIDTANFDTKREDEIGKLNNSFVMMIENLRASLLKISEIAGVLSTSSQELASSSEEVNASSEEISSISQQMSRGAQDQTLRITESTKSANNLRSTFEQKIDEINQTTALIEQISSQVNMLALNASIEAARAGEYGRGFAVVADNIRNLAEDSNKSVTRVQDTVKSLKESLSKSIDDIINSVDSISTVAEETASGAEEASAATEEQAATMEEMTASAQELANLALELESIVKVFKI